MAWYRRIRFLTLRVEEESGFEWKEPDEGLERRHTQSKPNASLQTGKDKNYGGDRSLLVFGRLEEVRVDCLVSDYLGWCGYHGRRELVVSGGGGVCT
jgi:hypothetical protein